MNAINYALKDLHFNIPEEVLELAFFDNYWMKQHMPQSVDSLIKAKVIMAHVMVDVSTFSGTQLVVPLGNVQGKVIAPYQTLYSIPKGMTQGRSINNIMRMDFMDINAGIDVSMASRYSQPYAMGGSNHAYGMTQAIYQTNSPQPAMSTPFANIVGDNEVLVCGEMTLASRGSLVVTVGFDDNASAIQPMMYQAFSRLVELGVKSYIWRTMVVVMDRGKLYGGYDLNIIKDIIDEYKDSYELYKEYLDNTWKAASILDDLGSSAELIQLLVPR